MARIFSYDGREFPDPDPKVPVEEVRRQLAEFFPELVNADTRESKRDPDTLYTFTKRIGTKG
jgi:PRTRC genetic system protein C